MPFRRDVFVFLLIVLALLTCGGFSEEELGTSVVVLVDFSASFSPLQGHDARGLREVARAIANLSGDWSAPIKITWSKIEEASLLARPLCGPIEFSPRLIKRRGEIADREELRKELENCGQAVVKRSSDPAERSPKTDISGAVLMAAEMARNTRGEKVVLILSDFDEDLPKGTLRADFRLTGERVVMIHRPWSKDAGDPNKYFQRIGEWSNTFRERGAKEVIEWPVFSITEHRLARGLRPAASQAGTYVAILADLKAGGVSEKNQKRIYRESLFKIARALSDSAKDLPPPVTITWSNIGSSGTLGEYLPPVEFNPRLIKKAGELNISEDLKIPMEESATGLVEKFCGTAPSTDIAGAVALAVAGSGVGEKKILIVLSDFVDNGRSGITSKFPLNGATVLMVYRPARSDRLNENALFRRITTWEKTFRDSGASSVWRIAMASLEPSDIKGCFSSEQAEGTTK